MSKLVWDKQGEKLYETGVKNGILFVFDPKTKKYGTGIAWNGLTAVTESPEGAEANDLYADDIKYLSLISAEQLKATIEAYMYPDEFEECDGTAPLSTVPGVTVGQQSRKTFAFCYTTTVGNDTESNQYGEKIHIIYGCLASPSEKGYQTINDSPEAITFSWEISTTPVPIESKPDLKPTASVAIDSTKFADGKEDAKYKAIKDVLYGTDSDDSALLLPDEIIAILEAS